MTRLPSRSVSEVLACWQAGDPEALRALVPLVYAELRRLAHRYLENERPDHTLQSTALVHEAYLRLANQEGVHFENRNHFFAVSALLMRQILVEYAREPAVPPSVTEDAISPWTTQCPYSEAGVWS